MAEQKWKLFIRPDYDASRTHLKIHWRKSFTQQIMHPLTMIMVWRSAEKWKKKTKNTAPAESPLCHSPTPPPPWHSTEVKCSRSFLVLLDVFAKKENGPQFPNTTCLRANAFSKYCVAHLEKEHSTQVQELTTSSSSRTKPITLSRDRVSEI